VSVEYVATKDSFWCKHHATAPYTYTRASRRTFEYYPSIKSNKHSINLSLSELSPNKGCQYRPIWVSLLLAPQPYEPLRKNVLLLAPQYFSNGYKRRDGFLKVHRFTSKVLNATCFPIAQSALLADDPNKHWICYQSPQKHLMYVYDFDPNKNLELTLNIRAISKEKYESSCFHWSAHHKEKCQ
jgi:hypothetical protein